MRSIKKIKVEYPYCSTYSPLILGITVAHRLSTIRNSDVIAVCQKGHLLE